MADPRFAALAAALAAAGMACTHASPGAPRAATSAPGRQVLVPGTGSSPYSKVVRGGDLVFVAGQLGFVQGTRDLAPGGVGPETRAALDAITANLAQAGLGMDDVVKCDVFLADVADFPAMNEAYSRYFPKDPPARTTVGVAGLWAGARVEIDCIAAAR